MIMQHEFDFINSFAVLKCVGHKKIHWTFTKIILQSHKIANQLHYIHITVFYSIYSAECFVDCRILDTWIDKECNSTNTKELQLEK